MNCIICKIETRKEREVCDTCEAHLDMTYKYRSEEREKTLNFHRNLAKEDKE